MILELIIKDRLDCVGEELVGGGMVNEGGESEGIRLMGFICIYKIE
jgi:hypothetical protein